MLQRGLITILLLSGVVYSMGNPPPNYDSQYDEVIEEAVSADIEAIEANRLAKQEMLLSALKLKSLVFQEKFITRSDGKKVKKNIPVEQVVRGTNVVYINIIKNPNGEKQTNILVKNPIPDGTEYIKDSATCNGKCTISYSTDEGETLNPSDKSGASYIEFHFPQIESNTEVRMGFRATVK
ncbi:hypothetical protein GSY74_06670 [Sulfurovum sp. bin170]|uniref:hypothetical protein n=1 Tax=Sulfurovum sp. bin170 TaxID=2695268 RepID=UPI0013DF2A74|nr:hypothetical protein [Sulfurovum sp. bin170]NEW60964.1 hypothetical protein [Sulfurovum sp. bin170]